MIRLANAPVSYGVFELTVGTGAALPDPDELLDAVAEAGYQGIDLGPLGFLGTGTTLRERLAARGLALAGGWVALRLTEPSTPSEDLRTLDAVLDALEAAPNIDSAWPPKPTLADAGSPSRRANPGRGRDMAEIGLDDEGWGRLSRGVERAAERCRARGFEPTFHHHACTYVEAPHEIELLLELTDIGLCLDTGHLLLGGGDPRTFLLHWRRRVNHIHLKDALRHVMDAVVAERAEMEAVWIQGAFCELGAGDLDVDGFLDALSAVGYSGWILVEQDRIPVRGEGLAVAASAQERNLAYLRERGIGSVERTSPS
jgi:inosose dehydratase